MDRSELNLVVGMRLRIGFSQSSTGISPNPLWNEVSVILVAGTLLLTLSGDHRQKLREGKQIAKLD
jgi:hypothetical protein